MQEKIQRAEIWQLESLHIAFADSLEVLFDSRCGHFAHQHGIILVAQGNQTDVSSVAFIT